MFQPKPRSRGQPTGFIAAALKDVERIDTDQHTVALKT
jgi:hypothetical protein